MMRLKPALVRQMFLVVAELSFLASHALADMPSNTRTFKKKDYVFGDVVISQSFDSRKDPMDPVFKLQLRNRGRLVLVLTDVSFDDIHPSPDGELFVGLSNGGWPGTAVAIFDRRGRVWFVANHTAMALDYCAETSTFLKEWYDPKKPDLRFAERNLFGDEVQHITLRNCKGETIVLWDVIKQAMDKAKKPRQQEGH